MSTGGQFCLRWNNHQPNMVSVFTSLLQNDQLVDVTLLAENNEIHAHKIVLSACSPYFQVYFLVFFFAITLGKNIFFNNSSRCSYAIRASTQSSYWQTSSLFT